MFLPSPWNDIRVKHAWDAVPTNWECQAAHQPTLRMIYVALAPPGEHLDRSTIRNNLCWLPLTSVPVFQVNELLGAFYQLYRHAETNDTIIRTVGHALPMMPYAHVQCVALTMFFAFMHTLP
ncbi:hypothetical protein EI94DRAFT_1793402 [Lactarius quietus]|nr:hypothetical protein EI94DRAFT_1793402 [Lactarius quietus]